MKLFKIFLFTTFLLFLSFSFFHIFRYRNWEKDFLENKNITTCFEDINVEEEIIDERIEKFIISDSGTEFVVFSVEEVLYILRQNMSVNGDREIQDICIIDQEGEWIIHTKYQIENISMPWLVFHIVKDNRETPELYIRELYMGKAEIPFGLGRRIMVDMNRGISEAIVILNENQFLGRKITNIELLEERVVIKGALPR